MKNILLIGIGVAVWLVYATPEAMGQRRGMNGMHRRTGRVQTARGSSGVSMRAGAPSNRAVATGRTGGSRRSMSYGFGRRPTGKLQYGRSQSTSPRDTGTDARSRPARGPVKSGDHFLEVTPGGGASGARGTGRGAPPKGNVMRINRVGGGGGAEPLRD